MGTSPYLSFSLSLSSRWLLTAEINVKPMSVQINSRVNIQLKKEDSFICYRFIPLPQNVTQVGFWLTRLCPVKTIYVILHQLLTTMFPFSIK